MLVVFPWGGSLRASKFLILSFVLPLQLLVFCGCLPEQVPAQWWWVKMGIWKGPEVGVAVAWWYRF